ncbi:MAG: hypothetical protein IJ681_01935 [Bacteroidales bacterium]|nr:hypothetical protein [Bacteroidales bacterium]
MHKLTQDELKKSERILLFAYDNILLIDYIEQRLNIEEKEALKLITNLKIEGLLEDVTRSQIKITDKGKHICNTGGFIQYYHDKEREEKQIKKDKELDREEKITSIATSKKAIMQSRISIIISILALVVSIIALIRKI